MQLRLYPWIPQPTPPPWWKLKVVEEEWPPELRKVSLWDALYFLENGHNVMVEGNLEIDKIGLDMPESWKVDPRYLARYGLSDLSADDLVSPVSSDRGLSFRLRWNSLPRQVRATIISFTWRPRPVIIIERTVDTWWGSRKVIQIYSKPPVSLHINRESRLQTLHHYRPIWTTEIGNVSYIRPYTDVLFVQSKPSDSVLDRVYVTENSRFFYGVPADLPLLSQKYLRAINMTHHLRMLRCGNPELERRLLSRPFTPSAISYLFDLWRSGKPPKVDKYRLRRWGNNGALEPRNRI